MIIEINGSRLIHGDSIQELPKLEDESIGFSVFSPPFPDLYCYSDDIRDLGNCSSYDEFEQHLAFLAPQIFRVLKPGRNIAIHCMDTPVQKGKYGYIGLRDFSGLILRLFESAGFIYHSRITIWKNPVTEMQRTKALGLLHKQVKKDATMSRVGIPDYVLVFRKDGERSEPVKCPISVDTWQRYASPVWMDIDYGDTLNGTAGREEKDEKHICPLQLPTIERLIHLYTNEGDTILTPFMGIGSEVFQAIKMGRKGIGIELKRTYFDQAVKNVKGATEGKRQLSAFVV
jgi:DNA modification methylase